MSRFKKIGVLLATVAFAALLVSACGDDSDSGGDSGGSTSSNVKFKGEPVVVAVDSFSSTPIGSASIIWSGAKAAARSINAKGGIKGHELKIATCDTNATPAGELACARKEVSSKAISQAGGFTLFAEGAYLNILDRGNMQVVGATNPQPIDYISPNTYPIDFGSGTWSQCASPAMAKLTGEKKIGALVEDTPATLAGYVNLASAARHFGTGPAGQVGVAGGATDLAPIVPRVAALKTNWISPIVSPNASAAFLTASQAAGQKYTFCTIDGIITGKPLITLANAAKNFYLGMTLPPLSEKDNVPGLKRFIADMKAQKDDGDGDAKIDAEGYNSISLRAWTAINVVAQIAATLPDPTDRDAFKAAIAKADKVTTDGITPTLNFTAPQKGGAFLRVFNPVERLGKWDGDKKQFVLVPEAPDLNGLKGLGN